MEMATIADTAHCREFKAQLLSLKGIISVQFIALCRQFILFFSVPVFVFKFISGARFRVNLMNE